MEILPIPVFYAGIIQKNYFGIAKVGEKPEI